MSKNYVSLGKVLIGIILMLTLQAFQAKAAWGDFDPSFGVGGVAFDQVTAHYPRGTAIQPDGKILVSGYRNSILGGKAFFLRRYLSNGALDVSFGNGGAATVSSPSFLNADYRGDKIVVQANGKIAVAGRANGEYAVWQITASGNVDKTFGTNGLKILTGYPIISNAYPELNIQDGKLLLSIRKQIGNITRVALIRLNSNGTFDTGFGISGESLTDIRGSRASGTVVETDGKITVGGWQSDDLSLKGLERKLANGRPDMSFFPTPAPFFGTIMWAGLVKMANGKYVIRMGNLASNTSITGYLDIYSSTGVFESVRSLYNGFQSSRCPEVFTNQNDGKVIFQQLDGILRLNAELQSSAIETYYCLNLNGITNFARASIQADDKMVSVGVYDNNLILVRTLPN